MIYYASKHGATKQLAVDMARKLNASYKDIKDVTTLEGDCIILGASVYVGSFSKAFKAFWNEHKEVLKDKRVYLYVSCLNAELLDQVIQQNLGDDAHTIIKEIVAIGGVINCTKMSFMERMIIKVVNKKEQFVPKVKKDTIINRIDQKRVDELLQKVVIHE